MTLFYSATAGGFFDDTLHAVLPADARAESEWALPHAALFAGQAEGKRIVSDDDGLPILIAHPVPATLDEARATQSDRIREVYDAACEAPVSVLGVAWNGGFDSAIKLDAAMRLAQAAGAAEVVFFDKDNVAHILNFEDALAVVVAIAADFQAKLARKQARMAAIAGAATLDDVSALAW